MIGQGAMARFRFGGGASDSTLHPIIAVCLLIAVVLILIQPRVKAITPFLLAFFTIPTAQVLVLGGVHLTAHQILIVAVLARIFTFRGSPGEAKFAGGFKALDWAVIAWSLSELVMFSLQWMEMQAVVKSLGDLVINLGGYIAVRFLIPDREVLRR